MFEDYLRTILRIKIAVIEPEPEQLDSAKYSGPSEDIPSMMADVRAQAAQQRNAAAASGSAGVSPAPAPTKTATIMKNKDDPFANVGRNDPCPCGSGKKFKKCHGANQAL
jgi:preprotein translocase subunit SecA